jgi:hypothetical protein
MPGKEARVSRPVWLVGIALVAFGMPATAEDPVRPPFLDAVRPPAEAEQGEENPFEDRIETDRDAFTPTPKLIGLGRLGIESAYSFVDNRGVKETHSFPELLVRYGLTPRIELRLGWNYEVGGESSTVSGSGSESGNDLRPVELRAGALEEALTLVRETTLTYGAKIRLSDQDGWRPESSLIVVGQTPTSGPENTTQVGATYVVGWELPNRWKLDAALRYATAASEGDHYHVWAPSAVVRVPIGERATAHAEYFGLFSRGREVNTRKQFVSGGVSYLLTPDLEVGVRGGPGLNDQSAFWFVNAGFGWRF